MPRPLILLCFFSFLTEQEAGWVDVQELAWTPLSERRSGSTMKHPKEPKEDRRGTMEASALLITTEDGLYCPAGDFYIDPWNGVDRAVLTHAHSDHTRRGSQHYLIAQEGERLFRARLGESAPIDSLPYGHSTEYRGVRLSFHPAGHVFGSAQVRVEYQGEIWVVAGDYKLAEDPTARSFEPVRCHTFVTESTFGLPAYRWESPTRLMQSIDDWWRANREQGKTSLLFAYSLGKAQRLLASVDASIGPIFLHGATETVTRAYRESGVALPATQPLSQVTRGRGQEKPWLGSLVIAPPSAHGSPWAKKLEPASTGIASGWMQVRGARRRRAVDRGFVISDHADWPGLLTAIQSTGAPRVLCTHGFTAVLARYLREQGLDADVLVTRYGDEELAEEEEAS